jgi:hypothetical protein
MSKEIWIQQIKHAAQNYETLSIWGGATGVMTYGCIKRLTKALAVYNWIKSIQTLCFQKIATVNALVNPAADGTIPDSYLDYSSLGACPHTPGDLLTELLAAPTITSFTPMNGPTGTSVTITGTNFTGATAVKFNGVNASSFSVNGGGTTITCAVPAGPIGSIISVTTPIGIAYSDYVYTRA